MPAVVSPPGYLPAEVYLSPSFTGAILIGSFFSVALMGVVAYMTYVYFERFSRDRLLFRLTVGFMLFLNLLHTAFVCHYEYANLIDGFGDIAQLTNLKWSITGSFTLTGLCACIVELFYAFRTRALLNRSLFVPVIITVMAVAGLVFSVFLNVRASQIYVTYPEPWRIESINWLFDVSLALPAAADFLIVGSMITGLYRASKLELPHTSWRAIRRVLFLAVETNVVTTVLCVVAAVMFATSRRPISFAVLFNLPKIYAITLLSSLLARQPAQSGIKGDYAFDASNSASLTSRRTIGGSPGRENHAARGVRIACTTQTVVEKDGVLELVEPMPRHYALGLGSPEKEKEDSIDEPELPISTLSYV